MSDTDKRGRGRPRKSPEKRKRSVLIMLTRSELRALDIVTHRRGLSRSSTVGRLAAEAAATEQENRNEQQNGREEAPDPS